MPLLNVGDQAPDVTFNGPDRTTVVLKDFQGKKTVVLAFYPRAFTGGWEREMRFFQTLLPQFEGLDTQVLGSSTDAVASQKAFADHCGVKFPLISDHPNFAGAKAFGVFDPERISNARVAYVIDKQGMIRHVLAGLPDMESYGKETLEVVKAL